MKEEIFVHHKEGLDFELGLQLAHHVKQRVSAFVKVHEFALTAEESRRCTEIAAHGTAYGGNDGGRGAAFALGQAQPHDSSVQPGNNCWVANGSVLVCSQVAAHPGNAFSTHDVVGIDHVLYSGNGGYMTAYHDGRVRR